MSSRAATRRRQRSRKLPFGQAKLHIQVHERCAALLRASDVGASKTVEILVMQAVQRANFEDWHKGPAPAGVRVLAVSKLGHPVLCMRAEEEQTPRELNGAGDLLGFVEVARWTTMPPLPMGEDDDDRNESGTSKDSADDEEGSAGEGGDLRGDLDSEVCDS